MPRGTAEGRRGTVMTTRAVDASDGREEDAFSAEWTKLMRSLGVASNRSELVLADLLQRHREPQRRYHTAAHVSAVIRDLYALSGATPTAILTAYFHDAVYDPTRGDNEAQSAALARRAITLLQAPAASALVEDVCTIVLATAKHELPVDAPTETAAFLDADLAVLASDDYANYVNAVAFEYGDLDGEEFRAGRAAVLQRLLAREYLFLRLRDAPVLKFRRGGTSRANYTSFWGRKRLLRAYILKFSFDMP